jgi:hypothetical protein
MLYSFEQQTGPNWVMPRAVGDCSGCRKPGILSRGVIDLLHLRLVGGYLIWSYGRIGCRSFILKFRLLPAMLSRLGVP